MLHRQLFNICRYLQNCRLRVHHFLTSNCHILASSTIFDDFLEKAARSCTTRHTLIRQSPINRVEMTKIFGVKSCKNLSFKNGKGWTYIPLAFLIELISMIFLFDRFSSTFWSNLGLYWFFMWLIYKNHATLLPNQMQIGFKPISTWPPVFSPRFRHVTCFHFEFLLVRFDAHLLFV